jgi:hypothetical protein
MTEGRHDQVAVHIDSNKMNLEIRDGVIFAKSEKTDSLIRIEWLNGDLFIMLASRDNDGTMRIESTSGLDLKLEELRRHLAREMELRNNFANAHKFLS